MSKFLILLLIEILTTNVVFSQTGKIYFHNSSYCLCRIESSEIYDCQNNRIVAKNNGYEFFNGNSTFNSDIVFNIKGNKIYKKNSTFDSDCIYTIVGNRVFKGNSTFASNCVYTYKDKKLYKGNSTFDSDCIYTIDIDGLNLEEIICILQFF